MLNLSTSVSSLSQLYRVKFASNSLYFWKCLYIWYHVEVYFWFWNLAWNFTTNSVFGTITWLTVPMTGAILSFIHLVHIHHPFSKVWYEPSWLDVVFQSPVRAVVQSSNIVVGVNNCDQQNKYSDFGKHSWWLKKSMFCLWNTKTYNQFIYHYITKYKISNNGLSKFNIYQKLQVVLDATYLSLNAINLHLKRTQQK